MCAHLKATLLLIYTMAKRRSQATKENANRNRTNENNQLLKPRAPSNAAELPTLDATPMPLDRAPLEVTPELSVPSPPVLRTPLIELQDKLMEPLQLPLYVPSFTPILPGVGVSEPRAPPSTPCPMSGPPVAGLDELPETAAEAALSTAVRELDDAAAVAAAAAAAAVREPDDAAAAAVRGMDEFAHIDFWEGDLPVKNTFINFATVSPGARPRTKELSGLTEPKDFAPRPFISEAPEPASMNPVPISLLNALDISAPPATSRRIQLNLSVWIPASSKNGAAVQQAQRVSLAEHLETRSSSKASAPAILDHTAAPQDGDPVVRRLFAHNTV
jgi:hypothetical protein